MDVSKMKGVGPTLEKKLNNIGIFKVNDLIEYYPYRYNVINIVGINEVNDGDNCMVKATIVDPGKVQYIKRFYNSIIIFSLSIAYFFALAAPPRLCLTYVIT